MALGLFSASPALAAGPVDDGTRAAARQLGYSGVEAYQAGNYAGASEKLERAYRVLRVPSLGLWSARALEKLGKLLEASERYREVTALEVSGGGDVAVQKKAQADAAVELEALGPRMPSIVVRIEGAPASEVVVTIDGGPLSAALVGENRPVSPGKVHVQGTRGSQVVDAVVMVKEGEQRVVELRFGGAQPLSTPTPERAALASDQAERPTSNVTAIAITGVATGLFTAGAVITGVLYAGRRADFERGNENLDPNRFADRDSAKTLGVANLALTAGAVVSGGLCVYFVVSSGASDSHATATLKLSPMFGPGGAAGASIQGNL